MSNRNLSEVYSMELEAVLRHYRKPGRWDNGRIDQLDRFTTSDSTQDQQVNSRSLKEEVEIKLERWKRKGPSE